MAFVAPFKGIRYNESQVGDLNKVVSPPYDIIPPDDNTYYHSLHPNNFVRVVLGREEPQDNGAHNRFTRSKQCLEEWLSKGVLKQDEQPSIYVYQQQFERDGKQCEVTGLVCAVKLHDYADKVIVPHENTLAKPKSLLGNFIRQTRANLDSVYGLFDDESGEVSSILNKTTQSEPDEDVSDKDGVKHRIWVLSDPEQVSKIVDEFKDKAIAIADGHHRYETALAYSKEMREQNPDSGELPSDYTIMTLVNVYQEDITVFPTHRVVGGIDDSLLSEMENNISAYFDIQESSREKLLDDMAAQQAIGLYRKGSAVILKPNDEARSMMTGCEASRKLELNLLHDLILSKALGIDKEKLRNQTHIVYTRDSQEAMDLVDSGERQMAFLLNNIEVKAILDIASAGEKMPQKATYFYPKLLSGLVLRKLD